MNAIVAVSADNGIGAENDLLFNIPGDKKFFRSTTKGKVVVMGRKTLQSLPGGKPLADRVNIVLSQNSELEGGDVTLCRSLDELLEEIGKYPADDVWVIGGESVYKLLLPYCKKAYVTHIEEVRAADKFFPDIKNMSDWELAEVSDVKEYEGIKYSFAVYENKRVGK